MQYLQWTKDSMLIYMHIDNLLVIGYSNLDFFSCVDTRKTTFEYIFIVAGKTIFWKSTKQSIVAMPIMEA